MARGGFPGMGGANMQQLMRQAQKMQQDMQRAPGRTAKPGVFLHRGRRMVTATVTGARELTSITISPDCVDPDDVEMLQDLVMAAVNGALHEATETTEREMSRITGGMNLGL